MQACLQASVFLNHCLIFLIKSLSLNWPAISQDTPIFSLLFPFPESWDDRHVPLCTALFWLSTDSGKKGLNVSGALLTLQVPPQWAK